jgi:hypothetical protein
MAHMQQWRKELWDADMPLLNTTLAQATEVWRRADEGARIPGYQRTRGETLLREIVAAVFVKLLLWSNSAFVYGGYAREFVSGKEWADIDACFVESYDIQKFKEMAGTMLCTLLGSHAWLSMRKVETLRTHSLYSCEVHRHALTFLPSNSNTRAIEICVDFTTLRNSRGLFNRLPASYGSCLMLDIHGIRFQKYQEPWHCGFTLGEICDLLRRNYDLLRLPNFKEWANHRHKATLAEYHATKKARLEEIGYEVKIGTGLSMSEYQQADVVRSENVA